MWSSQADAEGLTLLKADNKTGYFGVHLVHPGTPKPYQAQLKRGGTTVYLGSFATAEEAALCVARTPEGQAAAKRPAAAPLLTSEEARQHARAEGLTLVKADNKAGYFGVHLAHPGKPKPYQARVRRGGKLVHLGMFATAEAAALCVARTPEGQAAAKKAAASEEGNTPAMPPGATLKEEGAVPPMPPGALVKEEQVAPPMPPGAFVKEEGVVPPMPPDALSNGSTRSSSRRRSARLAEQSGAGPSESDARLHIYSIHGGALHMVAAAWELSLAGAEDDAALFGGGVADASPLPIFALYLAHARLGAPFEREREIVPTLAPFGRCIFPHISLCWCVCVSVQSPQHACVPTVAMRIMLHVNCGGQHKQDHFFFFFSTMKIRCACAAKLKYKKHAFTGLTFIASGDRNRETGGKYDSFTSDKT
jgi:hypothetical protein